MFYIYRLTFFLLVTLFVDAHSQTGNYEMVAHYNTDNGLPQNTVSAMVTDKNGFVWFGTQSGIVRFYRYNIKSISKTYLLPSFAKCRLLRQRVFKEEANKKKQIFRDTQKHF